MISVLKLLLIIRTRTIIELWPSGYSFPHAIASYVFSYNKLAQLYTCASAITLRHVCS